MFWLMRCVCSALCFCVWVAILNDLALQDVQPGSVYISVLCLLYGKVTEVAVSHLSNKEDTLT